MGESPFTHEEMVKGGRRAGLLVRDRYGKTHFRELGKRSAAVRRGRLMHIPLVVLVGETRRETARRYGIHLRTLYYVLRRQAHG
jgi:DNA invertase Pin-like site-specific DNA recombinase